ncbi:DUF504 domain-containing protein [bacterium]|nr:DUF504 domain-containing protein [bacterium]
MRMRKGKIREILEAMIWDNRNRPIDYRIVFISRGESPNNLEEVRGDQIEVKKDRIKLSDGREIPHHRIVAIWKGNMLIYLRELNY